MVSDPYHPTLKERLIGKIKAILHITLPKKDVVFEKEKKKDTKEK